jgi:hypothetical protein
MVKESRTGFSDLPVGQGPRTKSARLSPLTSTATQTWRKNNAGLKGLSKETRVFPIKGAV